MKTLLTVLMFTQVWALAQPRIKEVLVEGKGIPIVMLAGGTADMSALAIPAKELSGNYKVVRMEHFNVQYATKGLMLPKNYSVRMESEAIRYTLDSLHIREPVVVVGHSYGGVMALDFALNHPGRIRSLVLIEPPVFSIAEYKKQSPEGMRKMQALLKELTPDAQITEEHVERFRCALLHCDTLTIRRHPQWVTWIKQKDRLRGLAAVCKYKISLKQLHQFQKPVLIITGTQTVPFHKRIDELLAEEFPSATKVTIQSGHAVPVTAPRELVQSLLEFLK